MSKGLIIVESPAKAGTISKFLKNQFSVKASMGHIRDLPKRELGVNVHQGFKPVYIIDKTKSKVIAELKEATLSADSVYLASDNDREGEAIAWHLSETLKKELNNKPVYRIVFNEITSQAINEAIKNPGQIDMAKVEAQQARRILDRLVGYEISPLLWKVITKDLSAGRVQSVALRLICEREAEIKAFVPKEYWKIEADFWKDNLPPFKAVLEKIEGKKVEIPDEKSAIEIVENSQNAEAILSEIKRSNRNVEPLPPFITSTLQQEASKILGFQAQKTMSIAQVLYEGIDLGGERTGLITYMRTDSTRMAEEAITKAQNLIKERFGKELVHPKVRVFKNKQSAQDAHEAIRPTDPFRTPESVAQYLTKEQMKLYTLIWQRFIATQMIPVKLLSTSVKINAGKAEFVSSGAQIMEEGFLKAYPHLYIPLGEKIHQDYAKNDVLEHSPLEKTQHFTTSPARYTEASLIKELEAKGIGRPSTYATIIETLRKRKYVTMEKKAFLPTQLGSDVNRFLVDKFDYLFNVQFTAEMETKLDEVEYSNIAWNEVVQEYYDQLVALIRQVDVKKEKNNFVQDTGIVCDVCKQGTMLIKHSKRGDFLSCSRFPQCKNTKNFTRDEDGNIKIFVPTPLNENCPQCGSPLMLRTGKYGEFIACSNYPKCKYARPKTLGIKCPECGIGELTARKSKKGRTFYSCNRYPECKYITNDKPLPISCPKCGNPYIVEKYSREKGKIKICPNCKTEME
ncbi:type I DNA topoisomerase [Candidatus Cloacimonas acidaminovorans]|uniref:DNA topoisomerase 1 n=1 Tax=Cloacimonas acidaminovorans (strain Evry) TaxID=459349 RepID=B0VJB5_CLOAI|nr:type I DNA topoisomerase [Candidatus Cloacimonas acidaminovorans]CAO81569.1 DNA topoisomerase I [Candidatus Cloacimonas acidaminovorans str. Evry]